MNLCSSRTTPWSGAQPRFAAAVRHRHVIGIQHPLFVALQPAKIVDARYGTRCSSVMLQGAETRFAERAFAADGAEEPTLRYEFRTRRIS